MRGLHEVRMLAGAGSKYIPAAGAVAARARGYWRVLVGDGMGNIVVKLWYAEHQYEWLWLGQLVVVYTTHVSRAEDPPAKVELQVPRPGQAVASLMVSIFPERDRGCFFGVGAAVEEDGLCRTPLGYQEGEQLAGLITLKGYLQGGWEVESGSGSVKVLVCVKSLGGRKTGGIFSLELCICVSFPS